MLSSKAAMSLPPALRAECNRQLPASSVAISRFISMGRPLQSPPRRHFLTYTRKPHPTSSWLPTVSFPPMNVRWLSSSPICDHIDCSIAKDISVEDFDSEYFLIKKHNNIDTYRTQYSSGVCKNCLQMHTNLCTISIIILTAHG